MAAYRQVYDSRHLQADCVEWGVKLYSNQMQADCHNRDQLRNPSLSNRVWATFLPVKGR